MTSEWVHFEKNEELKAHKLTLPISIQIIIEWVAKIYGSDIVIDLDFVEIDKDLKYQYQKYQNDKKSLKKLYFDYSEDPYDYSYEISLKSDYYKLNIMYFNCYTMVHFLLFSRYRVFKMEESMTKKNKLIKQSMKMLKLLIENNIINIKHAIEAHTFGTSLWDEIKQLTHALNENQYSEDIIHQLVELIIICLNKKDINEQEAILRIEVRKNTNSDEQSIISDDYIIPAMNLLDFGRHSVTYSGYPSNEQLRNNHNIIEKLLFRGILPFQIIEDNFNISQWKTDTLIMQPVDNGNGNINEMKHYLIELLNKEKVFESIQKNEHGFPLKQMGLLAPLILRPYLDGAKKSMNELLSECMVNNDYIQSENLSNQISNIISYHLFVDYHLFYHDKIENDLNVKSIVFMNYMLHFEMDEQFATISKDNYSNKIFVNYLMNNYLYCISWLIGRSGNITFQVIRNLMDIYNEDFKVPLKSPGIYWMLEIMIKIMQNNCIKFENNYKDFIELLKYAKNLYPDEFDINFTNNNGDKLIVDLLNGWQQNGVNFEISMYVIKYILSEFNQYDVYNPCLLHRALKCQQFELIEYLMNNYQYRLDKICKMINNLIDDIDFENYEWDKWNSYQQKESQRFLASIKHLCLSTKCKNDKDIQLLNITMTNALSSYLQKSNV